MDIMKIYDRMPVFGQNLACTLEGVRVRRRKHGKLQQQKLPEFLERADWSYEELCRYRDGQLAQMVEHCYLHVPYYHRLFDELGIDYRSIRTLDDLSVLPILTKKTVRDNFSAFIADNVEPSQRMLMHTSGSTGSGFQFYYTKDAFACQWADKERYDRMLGLNGREWAAYFGGRPIVPRNCSKPPVYRINYAMREYMFSAFHLSPRFYGDYVKGLDSRKLEFWHGYPSSLVPIAQYMIDNRIHLSYVPKVIQLTSENITDSDLDKMEQAFGVRPLAGYAQTEQIANFWQFPDGKYHIMEDLDAVEFLPIENSELYRVVGTTLTNYAMPFLRYDTKDLVTLEDTPKGRFVLTVDGREEDCIHLSDGGVIRRVSAALKDQVHIVETQVIQKSYELLEFHVVRDSQFSIEDENKLNKDLNAFVAGRIGINVIFEDSIPKSPNGKRKFIVSEL